MPEMKPEHKIIRFAYALVSLGLIALLFAGLLSPFINPCVLSGLSHSLQNALSWTLRKKKRANPSLKNEKKQKNT
jgi:hypothetical protein